MSAFMSYTIAITLLVALATHLFERCSISAGIPSRWIWMIGILTSVGGPFFLSVERGAPEAATGSTDAALTDVSRMAISEAIPAGAREPAFPSLEDLNPLLEWAWPALSLTLCVGLVILTRRARREVEDAAPGLVSGTPVLLTESLGPAIVGAIRYRILLPRWVLELRPAQQEMIVAHEREHARAFDPLLLWVAVAIVVIFPWNPGLWYLMRRLRTSIELDCDRRVVTSRGDPHSYMTLLVDVGERVSGLRTFAPALAESRSQLHRRILAMHPLSSAMSRTRIVAFTAVAVVVLAGATRVPAPGLNLTVMSMFAGAPTPTQDTVGRAHQEYEVTDPVRHISGTGIPVYPAALKASKVEGEVIAQFVVDETGKVEMNTVRFIAATNDLFAAAVTSALREIEFDPARYRASRVRQLVQQAFHFRLDSEEPAVQTFDDDSFLRARRAVAQDSAIAMARRLEPGAFDRSTNPGSVLVGLYYDESGHLAHHSLVPIPGNATSWRVYYPRLFPDPEKADNPAFGLMADLESGPGGRRVGLVAVWMKDPGRLR